jgi:uncharacterized phage-associated protein
MASVHDVAAYILQKSPNGMSTMKLQKVCYYCQGWSLAWDEKPLFDEQIQAWANGPVIYELFKVHRGQFNVRKWPQGSPDCLSDDQKETIDAVLRSYGRLSGQQLSDKSHDEPPWTEARGRLAPGVPSSSAISLDSMQDYFGALAHEEAASSKGEAMLRRVLGRLHVRHVIGLG